RQIAYRTSSRSIVRIRGMLETVRETIGNEVQHDAVLEIRLGSGQDERETLGRADRVPGDDVAGPGEAGVGDTDEGGPVRAGEEAPLDAGRNVTSQPVDEDAPIRLDRDDAGLRREAVHV